MSSEAGHHVITFNGEIYNFQELRNGFASGVEPRWRGRSDTEVMIETIARHGLVEAVTRFNGMFAFGVWDQEQGTVGLARDRLGVKPLYVARASDGAILFASEVRSLAADRLFEARLNRAALSSYFAYAYMPRTQCIYCDAVSLAPGSLVEFTADSRVVDWDGFLGAATEHAEGPFDLRGRGWRYRTYWSALESWQRGRRDPFQGDFAQAADEAEVLLHDSVGRRMVTDVPLGALLSGGVDSSLVVALMQRQSSRRIRTFAIGFEDAAFDESSHAEAVAAHLGTDHTTLRVGRADALRVATDIGKLLDEPLADSSFVPTYLVSQLTRRHVAVAMTGDGGDEFFGGYWRYREFRRLRLPYLLPAALRAAMDAAASRLEIQPPVGRGLRWKWYRAMRLIRLAGQRDFAAAYRYAVTTTFPCARLLIDWDEAAVVPFQSPRIPGADLGEVMMHFDVLNVLPDDLLSKVDRASMAVGLECREPLLDYRIHEFAARLPLDFKLGPAAGKRLLKHVLGRHVPAQIIDRPKQGFAVPLRRWLRDELKEVAHEILFGQFRGAELFNQQELRRCWDEHQAGRHDHREVLWRVLVLKQWLGLNRWS